MPLSAEYTTNNKLRAYVPPAGFRSRACRRTPWAARPRGSAKPAVGICLTVSAVWYNLPHVNAGVRYLSCNSQSCLTPGDRIENCLKVLRRNGQKCTPGNLFKVCVCVCVSARASFINMISETRLREGTWCRIGWKSRAQRMTYILSSQNMTKGCMGCCTVLL